MITITTTEKWVEFKQLSIPVKSELNKVWIGVSIVNKGQVGLTYRFGKIDTRPVIDVPAVEEVRDETGLITQEAKEAIMKDESYFDFYTGVLLEQTLSKTDEEIKNYSYELAHTDSLKFLQEHCITENTTFAI